MFRKLKRSKRWDDRGVASTVGTVMAIMVILALLSLITNHYVPVWMKDNESGHMEIAMTQLGNFKTSMDNQMMFAEFLHYAGSEFTSTSVYTAVKLGSDGVPVFAEPTPGQLGINQNKTQVSVYAKDNSTGSNYTVNKTTMGNIELRVNNRYFMPQTLIYENGAIIRSQTDGEVIAAEPAFSVTNNSIGNNSAYNVAITLIWLFGIGSSSGSGLEGINSKLIGIDFQKYENLTSSIYINQTTSYGEAWYKYYNYTLAKAYNINSTSVSYLSDTYNRTASTGYYNITLKMTGFQDYTLSVVLKNPNNTSLKRLKLTIAYVDISIGGKKGGTEF